jgi:hypothetical protein
MGELKGNENCEFHGPCSLGPEGLGKNFPKLTNFQKSSSLQPHMCGGKTECMVL